MASSLLKNSIHYALAKTFYADVLSQRNMYYYFLGRTLSWGVTDTPPELDDTFDTESDVRKNIIFMKKISANDISFVARRINWIAETVYDRCDYNISVSNPAASGATNIIDANFYVLTDEMNVYKCIHNNNGEPSMVKPTGTEYDIMQTSDGYLWKYMYTIPPSLQYRFLTDVYMPVSQALTIRYYDNLGIDSVTINDGGSGYEGDSVTKAVVVGDGTGAEIGLSINPSTGSIAKVRIKNPGSGYTTGTIDLITTDDKGTGKYDGHATAILIPRFEEGELIDVTIEDPGINYSTDEQTNIVVSGNGEGAVLYPIVDDGEIVDVIIDNPGSGYNEVYLSIESVTGSGAQLSVTTGVGDVDSIQSDVELLAVPGTVYVVDTVSLGTNYTYATCTVTGDGTGLTVTPVINEGKIVRYIVENPGKNYTWCNIAVTGNGSGAECRPLMSPIYGHGYNAIDELFASSIMFYTTIKYEENQGIYVNNDYRQFGIIRNPTDFAYTTLYRDLNASTCYLLTVDNASSFEVDQTLMLSTDYSKKFNVVATDNITKILVQDFGGVKLTVNAALIRESDSEIFPIRAITYPKVNKKSGNLIFIDNRVSIYQTSNQYISLRTTFKF